MYAYYVEVPRILISGSTFHFITPVFLTLGTLSMQQHFEQFVWKQGRLERQYPKFNYWGLIV